MVSLLSLYYSDIKLLTLLKDKCLLEALPVELRILILSSISDLHSLRAIVLASPAYRQAYRPVRGELLRDILYKAYNGLVDVPDAITAVRSKGLHAYLPSNKERIISLLDDRRRSDEVPDTPVSIDETIQLLDLHRIAIFLLNDHCTFAPCPGWMDQTRWKKTEILPLRLSRTEKVRWLRGFYRLQIFANIFGPIELPVHECNAGKRDDWNGKAFTMEEAWRVFYGTMAPWEVTELGCVSQYIQERYTEPYNEIAEHLSQYGRVTMSSLPEDVQVPIGCRQWDATDLAFRANEILPALASMGPEFFYKFITLETSLDRRNLILANGRNFLWVLPDICPSPEDGLPLLYPADRFNFGEDFDGLKRLLATLPQSERPNLLCDRYLLCFSDMSDAFEEMFDVRLGNTLWRWGFALWGDERILKWNPPMDYDTACDYR